MLAVFLTVLRIVEGLETEALNSDFIRYWSDSIESVTVDFLWMSSSGGTITHSIFRQRIWRFDINPSSRLPHQFFGHIRKDSKRAHLVI